MQITITINPLNPFEVNEAIQILNTMLPSPVEIPETPSDDNRVVLDASPSKGGLGF